MAEEVSAGSETAAPLPEVVLEPNEKTIKYLFTKRERGEGDKVTAREFYSLCKSVYTTPESIAATVLYTGLGLIENKKSSEMGSGVVEKLTPWEMYLSNLDKSSRATHTFVDTGEGRQIDPDSMAKVALLWLGRNNGTFQNQPFDAINEPGKGKLDPRRSTDGKLKAAVRQPDGKYSVITLNSISENKESLSLYDESGGERTGLFSVEHGSDSPEDVQVVVDNRTVPKEKGSHLNSSLKSPFIGIASDSEGGISISADHLYMDGVAIGKMALSLGRYAETRNGPPGEALPENEGKTNPILVLDEIAPSMYKLSNTESLRAYARAMLATGKFKEGDVILIPAIGKFNHPTLDAFADTPDSEGLESHKRIQPVGFTLKTLASDEGADQIKRHFKEVRADINKTLMTSVFKAVHSPGIAEPVRKFMMEKLPKIKGLNTLAEKMFGVGLFSTPAEIKSDPSEDRYFTKSPRENAHWIANTMKSLTCPDAINLVANRSNGKLIFNLSGSESNTGYYSLEGFARTLELEAKKILDAKNKPVA